MAVVTVLKKCSVCKKAKATFMNNGFGYCGRSSVLGTMNMFGYCKAKKVESAELKKYVSRMAKLGMDYQCDFWVIYKLLILKTFILPKMTSKAI